MVECPWSEDMCFIVMIALWHLGLLHSHRNYWFILVSASNLLTFQEAKENQLGCGDKEDYFSCIATILYYRQENSYYKACPKDGCRKKVLIINFLH